MIYKIVNKDKLNFFNPTYEYYIYETMIDFDLDFLKQFILQKENEIIFNYPAHTDGDTGLGNNSLTSRYPYFNLLQYKELNFLKESIKKEHDNFLWELDVKNENVYVQCWANVMRKGDVIKKHSHYNSNYTYLGGHICIQSNNTSTHYVDPYTKEIFSSKNEFGKITLFPNWIEHYTDEVVDNKLRITIAFDLINEVTFKEDIYNNMKHHWIKL